MGGGRGASSWVAGGVRGGGGSVGGRGDTSSYLINKLFSDRIEIFSSVKFTRVAVMNAVVKVVLKVRVRILQAGRLLCFVKFWEYILEGKLFLRRSWNLCDWKLSRQLDSNKCK